MQVLTYPDRKPINWAHPPSATTRVSSDEIATDGVRFTGSMRTVCHMAHLMDLSVAHWGFEFHIIQPPFHTGLGVSEGTHDRDACSDLYPPPGVTHAEFQTWLRGRGFDNWWRHTLDWAAPANWHNHGFTHPEHGIGFATGVGLYVDGGVSTLGRLVSSSQIVDHVNHAFGLENEHIPGSDHTWFPPDQHKVAFDLGAYIRTKQEETMEYKDWSDASKQQLAHDIADIVTAAATASNTELLHRPITVRSADGTDVQKITVKQAIGRAANGPVVSRIQADKAIAALTADDASNGS